MNTTIELTAKEHSRFWVKVNKLGLDDCWNWMASKFWNGYGKFVFRGKLEKSHRVSAAAYLLGGIPVGMKVLHRCDNPACVNPNHLFIGTQADNMNDAKEKARLNHPIGEDNGRALITEEQIKEIRRLHDLGYGYRKLSRRFNVHRMTISAIVRRKSWKHI